MHTLQCTKPLDLNEFFRPGSVDYPIVVEEDRSPKILEINWARVQFEHYLKDGEHCITGNEKNRRQRESGHVVLGGNVFLSLLRDYEKHKEASVLEWLYRTRNIICLDFFRPILQCPVSGRRFIFQLLREGGDGGTWRKYHPFLEYDFQAHNLSPVLLTAAVKSMVLAGSS